MQVARVGDSVRGSCYGDYLYTVCGKTTCWDVTRSEGGSASGYIRSGSHNVFCNGKPVARVGDNVNISKDYSHGRHLDSLNITATISSGSSTVFCNGKSIARVGDRSSGSNCSGLTIRSGSSNVFNNK